MVNVFKRRRRFGGDRMRFKRRRTNRRYRRSRANSSFTSQKGTGNSFRFGGRKLSRRRWKNSLYASTRHLAHYRSCSQESNTVGTAVSPVLYKTWMLPALNLVAGFWTTAGGLQPLDDGGNTDVSFQGDLVIRGGTVGITINIPHQEAPYDPEPTLCFVALCKIRKGENVGTYTAGTTVGIGWEPTLVPDFDSKFGKIIFMQKKMLNSGDTWNISRHIGVQKVDQEVSADTNGYQWFMGFNDPAGQGHDVRIVRFFNLSFTGDATVNAG